jgi:hypothetical protein
MSKIRQDYSNYNKVSVKTDSMVKMIDQLAKLGVFKEKRKPRGPRKPKAAEEIRQTGDMGPGYAKPVEGGSFGLRTPLSQNMLEDIQRRNEATIARLSGEVQQQRLADIEAQQGQRFADITRLGGIINPLLERFRGAQEPGAGVYNPFMVPDVQEERFTQTLNEGGPEAVEEPQGEEIYAGEEEEEAGIPTGAAFVEVGVDAPGSSLVSDIPKPRIVPSERIPRGPSAIQQKREAKADVLGLDWPVPDRDTSSVDDIRVYYETMMAELNREVDSRILGNKKKMHAEIMRILAE